MKKFILLVFTVMLSSCEPQSLIVENHHLIWIDVTNPETVFFADLSDNTHQWQETTPDNVPGYVMTVIPSKTNPDDPVRVTIKSDRPVEMVKFATTLLGDQPRELLEISPFHVFTKQVDSVGVFRVILEND